MFPIYARYVDDESVRLMDRAAARQYLELGVSYLIRRMDVGRVHTTIYLEEFPSVLFDAALFEAGDKED